jgi:hypothetical protein
LDEAAVTEMRIREQATEPGNSAQASRQSARSSLTTLPTALAPIGLICCWFLCTAV